MHGDGAVDTALAIGNPWDVCACGKRRDRHTASEAFHPAGTCSCAPCERRRDGQGAMVGHDERRWREATRCTADAVLAAAEAAAVGAGMVVRCALRQLYTPAPRTWWRRLLRRPQRETVVVEIAVVAPLYDGDVDQAIRVAVRGAIAAGVAWRLHWYKR